MLNKLEMFLRENIDDNITIDDYREKNRVPLFLRKTFNFYEIVIFDSKCILLEVLGDSPSVDTIEKNIKVIRKLTDDKIIIYYKEITRYRRKSLIQNRIPFVIEDGQMFLPFLGLDLKKISNYSHKEIKVFSESAQLAYMFFLYNKNVVMNVTEFAKETNCTLMTASRVLNELYNAKLINYIIGGKTGRSKEYQRISDPEYFEKGLEYIKSPIKKIIYIKNMPSKSLIAGLEALAESSMLNPPNHKVRAISWDEFNKQNFEIVNNKDIIKDEKLIKLEIWWYDPMRFAGEKHVDNMSLYASLKEETDERIEQALEEILRGETWYMD